jgi:transcriptional regulator with XRE-family HTH domain
MAMPRRVPPYGPVIRYLREMAGLSEAELGARIGETDYYVGYLENGYRSPRPHQVERLARAFSWEVFELALLADVAIPYPDWPRLEDLDGWRTLARQWSAVVDAISRYALARNLLAHPDWQAALDPELPGRAREYGLVACYDWVRARWAPYAPDSSRLTAASGPESIRQALASGGSRGPAMAEPDFLRGLTAAERATVETVARSLRQQRSDHRPDG